MQIWYILKMIGTSSAQKSMFVFLSSSCYFSSSALVLLVSMDEFEHIYASELQLSTRFPFHCQDSFFWGVKGGGVWKWGRKKCWKTVPKGPQMDPKGSGGVSKRDPLQDQEKWDLVAIYYTLARSEVSEKTAFWVPFWDHLGDKIIEIGLQIGCKKVVNIYIQT